VSNLTVLLDGRPLQGPTGDRGVGHYVRDLVRGLLALADAPLVRLLVDPRDEAPRSAPAGPEGSWVRATAPPGPALLWGRLLGPRWIASAAPDLWHATFLAPPRVPRRLPWLATIHDLIPLRHPAPFTRKQRFVFARSLALAARAPRVVADSACTADLVRSTFGTAAARLEVIPPPVDIGRFARAARRGAGEVDRPYLLHLGGFDRLKGVADLLLPAFAAVARERRDLVLALTGPTGPGRDAVARVARDLDLERRVSYLGVLPDDDHAAVVAGAATVVLSSREEGFGLPAVEALAAGVPVALGPAAAPREAVGPVAALAPDDTPAGLAWAIREALAAGGPDSAEGAARRAHAARFDLPVVARQMLELYRHLVERGA
jgi:glycosyltransferase involved in cell wall biosynthesis